MACLNFFNIIENKFDKVTQTKGFGEKSGRMEYEERLTNIEHQE